MEVLDAEYNYHQEKIKSEQKTVRMNIGKLKAQINQITMDKKNFEAEMKMLIVTVGENGAPPVETKLMMEASMIFAGLERKEKSSRLKIIFILAIICICLELFVLSYKNSFMNMVGLCSLLYVLFCGYYTDKSILYVILYLMLSILLDICFVYLNIFSELIMSPIIYTYNTFLKYIGMIVVLVSIVGRVLLIVNLFWYREIPK
jgi:hypothetical protein